MEQKRDYYEVLGIRKGATDKEIKSAYRKMANKYHPDKNQGDKSAEEAFKEANEAYDVLSDKTKRDRYDRFGHAGVDPNAGFGGDAGASGGAYGGGFSGANFGFDAEDINSFMGAMFGNFGMGRSRRNGPMQGNDIKARMNISFREAAFGVKKQIEIDKYVECDACHGHGTADGKEKKTCFACEGRGRVYQTKNTPFGTFRTETACPSCHGTGKENPDPCRTCSGSGRVKKNVKINVTIPEGIHDGGVISLRGYGEPGINGGPPGDLYIVINVANDDVFERRGNDIWLEVPISFAQAALGDEITVPGLREKINYKIPAGTQPDTVFRIKEKGIKDVNSSRRGHLYITVKLEVPRSLNAEQKKIISDMNDKIDEKCYKEKSMFKRILNDLFS